MTRKRFAAIVTALLLLGFTLTPQAYVPCCCKGAKNAQHAGAAPCCPVQKPVKSCCATGDAVQSCPLHKELKTNCPQCRCLEHLHVVVLTGNSAGDTTTRVPAAILTSILPYSLTSLAGEAEVGTPNEASLGMAILLKTCIYLC